MSEMDSDLCNKGSIVMCACVMCCCGNIHDTCYQEASEAAEEAERLGWLETLKYGWMCPTCADKYRAGYMSDLAAKLMGVTDE